LRQSYQLSGRSGQAALVALQLLETTRTVFREYLQGRDSRRLGNIPEGGQ
jgi:hypothetical protein